MFDLHNPLICLNQPLLESPKFIFEYANHECCSRRTMFFNMNHWICLITFLSRVYFVPSLSASLSLTGLLWKPVMHINLCMLGNPKLSNVQQRWLTEGVQEEKPREGERERERERERGREGREAERHWTCERERATLQKDCMSVCTTRGRTLRDDWCTEIAQPIRAMTGK